MQFAQTTLKDAYLITFDPKKDQRGSFCRLFCSNLLKEKGIEENFVQTNLSTNSHLGTLRGLHFQNPFPETKIVCCLKGKIFDAIVDLRPDSSTYKKTFSIELSENFHQALLVPKGCAHGFLTLSPDTQVLYFCSEFFRPECDKGYRWNDPTFNISWPLTPTLLSEKDKTLPFFNELR